jgi:hypothetical protein
MKKVETDIVNGNFKKSFLKGVHRNMPILSRNLLKEWWLEENDSLEGLSDYVDSISGMLGYEFQISPNFDFATIRVAPIKMERYESLCKEDFNPKGSVINALEVAFSENFNHSNLNGVFTVDFPNISEDDA